LADASASAALCLLPELPLPLLQPPLEPLVLPRLPRLPRLPLGQRLWRSQRCGRRNRGPAETLGGVHRCWRCGRPWMRWGLAGSGRRQLSGAWRRGHRPQPASPPPHAAAAAAPLPLHFAL